MGIKADAYDKVARLADATGLPLTLDVYAPDGAPRCRIDTPGGQTPFGPERRSPAEIVRLVDDLLTFLGFVPGGRVAVACDPCESRGYVNHRDASGSIKTQPRCDACGGAGFRPAFVALPIDYAAPVDEPAGDPVEATIATLAASDPIFAGAPPWLQTEAAALTRRTIAVYEGHKATAEAIAGA